MTTKVLVTGGLGFMGSDFVRYLRSIRRDFEIVVIDNFSYSADVKRISEEINEVVVKNIDIRDYSRVLEVTKGADLVVNFAAETHNDNSLTRPRDFVSVNVDGVLSLLEAARQNGFKFHHVSTDEVFGDMPVGSPERFHEMSPVVPSSPYSASKAASDALCFGWHRSFGVHVTVSNSANNFGPFQHEEKLIPRSIARIKAGLRPELYGDGSNVRDWLNVRDHSRAVLEISQYGVSGSRYLISSHDLVSNIDLIRVINSTLGRSPDEIDFIDDRPGHDRQYASDSTRLRNELGWKPESLPIREWIKRFGKDL